MTDLREKLKVVQDFKCSCSPAVRELLTAIVERLEATPEQVEYWESRKRKRRRSDAAE